ncbi:MAG: HAMP domain-containing protein [Candidatus Margulisbacteria bacterium]|nr:HAMP domain-containing protein [Candidatus Margulisiibacteriota bacterium]
MKINIKLMIAFLVVLLIPLFLVFDNVYFNSIQMIETEIANHLESVAAIKKHKLNIIIEDNLALLRLVASHTKLRSSLKDYNQRHNAKDQGAIEQIIADAKASIADFMCITVLDPQGNLVASTSADPWQSSCVTIEAIEAGQKGEYLGSFAYEKKHLLMYLAAPLKLDNKTIGVVVIKALGKSILQATQNYSGLGKTGETLIGKLGPDGSYIFVTPPRFPFHKDLNTLLDKSESILPLQTALDGKEVYIKDQKDYRGVPVLAVTRYIDKMGWGLVAKIDKDEAYDGVKALKNGILARIAFGVFVALVLSFVFSQTISKPIKALQKGIEIIGRGDLEYRVGTKSKDEIGDLSRAFDEMVGNFRRMTTSRDQLDKEVKARRMAQEQLEKKLRETEVFQKTAVDRELKMRELKEEIRRLKEEKHG